MRAMSRAKNAIHAVASACGSAEAAARQVVHAQETAGEQRVADLVARPPVVVVALQPGVDLLQELGVVALLEHAPRGPGEDRRALVVHDPLRARNVAVGLLPAVGQHEAQLVLGDARVDEATR